MCTAHLLQVALEPAQLPSVSISTSKPLEWEGDLLVLAVTEEDLQVEGGERPATTAASWHQLLRVQCSNTGTHTLLHSSMSCWCGLAVFAAQ
jgi:hypothetical protein